MNKTLIIAEAGVNHNGDIELAKQMIDVAYSCGADIVKFQTSKLANLVSRHAKMANYQIINTGKEESQMDMLRKITLSYQDFLELADYCNKVGITFLSTPFDIESVHFLNPLQEIWKIPSGEITNYPYLVEIGKTKKKVILSTGMAELQEVRDAINLLRGSGSQDITLLHCTTEYPAPIYNVNLAFMNTLKKEFGVSVGYSDHTQGIEVALASVAMGATVIEKHFTLDRNFPGPDHKASLEPGELKAMVEGVRKIEAAIGDGNKKMSKEELANRMVARKSIVAKKRICKGDSFTEENITTKRPGEGLSPMLWNEVLGHVAERDYEEDDFIII